MKKYLECLLKEGQTSLLSIESDAAKNTSTVILKNQTLDKYSGELRGTYLGDVFKALPHGIINKTETGIGATTLELNALRNSIIVEPLKVTASSKASKKVEEYLYVGGKTSFHKSSTTKNQIEGYVTNSAIKHKKIIVVADSLNRVIDVLEAQGVNWQEEYFLLLDEVDSFQMDSTYRASLERCIDYYNMFQKKNRAMTTATMLSFSNPEFKEEPRVIFKYETVSKQKLNLYSTENIEEQCENLVRSILSRSTGKIVIAYNSVNGNKQLADKLVSLKLITETEIGILCSNSADNKRKCGNFFSQFSNTELPNRICFITSAYFTGFDIKERFHLISLSDGNEPIQMLSVSNHKQIIGRCRDAQGIISNDFVYNVKRKALENEFTISELITAGEKQVEAMKCFKSHYDSDSFLEGLMVQIREGLGKGMGNAFTKFVRTNLENDFEILDLLYYTGHKVARIRVT